MKKLFSIIALCLVGTATNAQAPYAQFQGGMIGCIEPQGWIEEFLHRQQTGLTGCLLYTSTIPASRRLTANAGEWRH